jgi:hypothetical protein
MTLVGWVAAYGCLQCTLDFDRFAPVAAAGADGGGTAGHEGTDSSIANDASQQPTDSGPTDSQVGDVVSEPACTPKQSCLDDAKVCAAPCTTSYDACVIACGGRQACKVTCDKTEQTCKRTCASTCQTCAADAGCAQAPGCLTAAQ